MMNKIKNFLSSRKYVINALLLLIVIFLGIYVFRLLHYKYISVEFKELRPMRERVEVFYKGIKVGYVRKMSLCHACKSTMVDIVLTYKGLALPDNTTAKFMKEKKEKKEIDFIELKYPENPSPTMIANGTVLDGKTTIDIQTFMANQDPDDLEVIKENLTQSSEELMTMLSALSDLFVSIQDVVKENQKNLYDSTYNMSQTTGNIRQITSKFDNSIKQKELNQSVSDIYSSTSSISEAAKSLQSLTGNFNNTSSDLNTAMMPQIKSTLYRTECLVANVNDITCGVKQTLKKPFGGLRILFGKTITSKNVKKCCPKSCRP